MSGDLSRTMAGVYAQALAEAAEALGALASVGEEIESFAKAWEGDRTVRAFFLSGAVPRAAKSSAIDRLCVGRASTVFSSFLQVLLRRDRLWLLPEAARAYHAIVDRRSGRVPVVFSTAAPVAPEDLDAWRERLKRALGREPVLVHEVRPALVGGAVLRVGDVVADGSVRRRLVEMRDRAVAASAQGASRAIPS